MVYRPPFQPACPGDQATIQAEASVLPHDAILLSVARMEDPLMCLLSRQVMRERAKEYGVAEVRWIDLGHADGSHTGIASGGFKPW